MRKGVKKILNISLLASMVLMNGCQSMDYNLPIELERERETKRALDRDIQNNLQILLYTGYKRNNEPELSNHALCACLDIIGWPEEIEKEYAMRLNIEEIGNLSAQTQELLSKRVQTINQINHKQERITQSYYRFGESHKSLVTLRWFIGSIAMVLGLVCLLIFLTKKW